MIGIVIHYEGPDNSKGTDFFTTYETASIASDYIESQGGVVEKVSRRPLTSLEYEMAINNEHLYKDN